jgi:hypothetical protein
MVVVVGDAVFDEVPTRRSPFFAGDHSSSTSSCMQSPPTWFGSYRL